MPSRSASYATLLLGLALVAGCGRETETSLPAPQTPGVRPAAFDLSPWQAAQIDWRQFSGVTLSVLGDAQPAFRALRPHLQVFEALTGIHVGYQLAEQDAMRQKRTLDLASGSAVYDVIPIGVTYLGEAHHNRWIEPLTPFLNDPFLTDREWYDFEDFSPNVLTLCSKGGQWLSAPFDFSAPVLFYRKDLFNRYAIPTPDTYEELVQVKQRLQRALDADGLGDIHAFATRTRIGAGLNTWTVIPAIRSYGGQMLDPQWRPVFNSPQAVQALTVYRDLATGYGNPPDASTLHFYEIRELFRSGRLASAVLASHFFNEIDSPEKSPIWDRWDAARLPRGPAGRETSPWAWAFAINADSRHKGAAWLFLQWLTAKPTACLLHPGGAPARRSVWEDDHYKRLQAPGLLDAMDWIFDHATADPMQSGLPEFPSAGLAVSRGFSEIFFGAPVQETLDKAVIEVETIMQQGPTRRDLAP